MLGSIQNRHLAALVQAYVRPPLVREIQEMVPTADVLVIDPKTWKLKPGVKWSDGQPFTSADALWTFNAVLQNKTNQLHGTIEAVADAFAFLGPHVLPHLHAPAELITPFRRDRHLERAVARVHQQESTAAIGTGEGLRVHMLAGIDGLSAGIQHPVAPGKPDEREAA